VIDRFVATRLREPRGRRARLARLVLAACLACGTPSATTGCGGGRSLPPRDEAGLARYPGSGPWQGHNLPLVKEYLSTLPDDSIGQPVKGILLSDGERWLEGYVFRGRPAADPAPGLHVVLLETDGELRAYLWLDEGADPYELPVCAGEEEGIRARELTGRVFTWRSLRPEHGIVYSPCPSAAWLPGSAG